MAVTLVLATLQGMTGLLLLFDISALPASILSLIMSALFWWIGQSFGQPLFPTSTDFNSGLLMILLSLISFRPDEAGSHQDRIA